MVDWRRSAACAHRHAPAHREFAPPSADPVASGHLEQLTEREREVLAAGRRQGLSNGEIATGLFISPATAKTHVSRIMMKLDGAGSRAARRARRRERLRDPGRFERIAAVWRTPSGVREVYPPA